MKRFGYFLAMVVLVALLALSAWSGLGWVQEKRADSLLSKANSHIETANGIMAGIEVSALGSESFTSLDSINSAAGAAESMIPLLEQAAAEVSSARDDAARAADIALIDEGYGNYLLKKEETAGARVQQLEVLAATTDQLQQLYSVGPVVFSSVQEMDRLFGQFQDALAKVQSSPAEASSSLGQIAGSFAELQKQLDQAYADTGFEILPELSRTAADNAELAMLAVQLADAAGSGDQAKAQQAAIGLEEKLLSTSISGNLVDLWWQQMIEPLEQEFAGLQSLQESLDAEAAALYEQRNR